MIEPTAPPRAHGRGAANLIVALIVIATALAVWFGVHAAYDHMAQGLIAKSEQADARLHAHP